MADEHSHNNETNSFYTRFRTWWKNFLKQGREHLTIMLVPHNEQSIINFQISRFAIYFIIMVISILLILSFFTLAGYKTTRRKFSKLKTKELDVKTLEKYYDKSINTVDRHMDELKKRIEHLAILAEFSSSGDIWGQGGSSEENITDISNINITTLNLMEIEQFTRDLQTINFYVKRLETYLNKKHDIVFEIPALWPVPDGGHITSGYGYRKNPFNAKKIEFHSGLDIAGMPGSPIIATADGRVEYVGYNGGYGNTVRIRHKYGFCTIYAHLSRAKVHAGQLIKRGDTIGLLGSSGRSTGAHLHYEVRIGNKCFNPSDYIFRATLDEYSYIPPSHK